jgi:predicted  nucleic acid-binding Zn-ribbon protein
MSVAAIKLYLNGQSPTVECDIPKIVEGSENYLGILPIRGQDWEDCGYINLSFSHEELAEPVYSRTTVQENGIAYRLVPNEVIKFPGFSLTVVGQDKASNPTYIITTKPIYFQVDLTGQVIINYAADVAAVDVGTMTVAQEAKDIANSAKNLANSAHGRIDALNINVTNINNRITTLTGNISTINSTLTNLNTRFNDFKTTTERSIKDIKQITTTLTKDIDGIKKTTLPAINKAISTVDNKVTNLNTNFSDFKTTTEGSIKEIKTTIGNFKTEVNTTINDFKKTTDSSFSTFKTEVNTTISDLKTDINTTVSNINTTICCFQTNVNNTLANFSEATNQTLSDSQSFIIINQTLSSDSWIEDGNDYYQVISNNDITSNSKVDIQLDNATFYQLSKAGLVFVVKQDYYGTINKTRETRIYSLGKEPEENYSIQLEITKLKGITGNTTIQGSPIGHLIDWNENTIRNKPTTTASDDVFSVTVSSGVCQIKLNKELYYE